MFLCLSYLSEDRQGTAVQTAFSVAENVTLSSLKQYCRFSLVNRSAVRSAAEKYIARFRIRAESPDTPLTSLSGGNQQKVVLGKWLFAGQDIYIFDEPTRGIDVNAKTEFYKQMSKLTHEGKSIIMISSDMPELISMSDRVLVVRDSGIDCELTGDQINEQTIINRALGVRATPHKYQNPHYTIGAK